MEWTYKEAYNAFTTGFIGAVSSIAEFTAMDFYEKYSDTNLYVELLDIARNAFYQEIKRHGIIKRISKVEKRSFNVVFARAWREAMEEIKGDVA